MDLYKNESLYIYNILLSKLEFYGIMDKAFTLNLILKADSRVLPWKITIKIKVNQSI